MTMSRRKAAIALAAAMGAGAAAASRPAAAETPPLAALWIKRACAGCGENVWYLPGQAANACARPGCPHRGRMLPPPAA